MDEEDEEKVLEYLFRIMKALEKIAEKMPSQQIPVSFEESYYRLSRGNCGENKA